MENLKQRLLTGWTFTRVLYVSLGTFVIINSATNLQWFGVLFGAYFASIGLFSIVWMHIITNGTLEMAELPWMQTQLNIYNTAGTYTVKLKTMSKNSKKMDETSKSITIN